MNKKRNSGALKTVMVMIITGFILFSAFTPVSAKSGELQKYDYDMQYLIKIPELYKDNIVDIGSGTLNVQFNEFVYLSLKVDDYYKSLSSEKRGSNKAADYSIGNEVLNDTYNNLAYVTTYFNQKLNTIIGKKRVTSIAEETMNSSKYWVCKYVIYTEAFSAETQSMVQADKGEGKMYLNMTSGLSYFLVVNSNKGLLTDTPDALKTLESFTIGRTNNPVVYGLWVLIFAFILGFVVLINNKLKFFSIEVEDDDGNTTILTGVRESIRNELNDVDEYEEYQERKAKRISENTIRLKNIKEAVQSKIEDIKAFRDPKVKEVISEPNFDEEQQRTNNQLILNKLDAILGRFTKDKSVAQNIENLTYIKTNEEILNDLDKILGRIQDEDTQPFVTMNVKTNEDILNDLDILLGRTQIE